MSATASSADIPDYIKMLPENEVNVIHNDCYGVSELNVTPNDCYGVNELKVTSNDCYGVISRNEVSANENASVLIKSAKFTKMENCLLVITAIQSVMLLVAIIGVAVTYTKCRKVQEELKFFSKYNALESANLSFLESSYSVLELETRAKLLEVVRDMNAIISNVSQQINHLNNSHEVLARKVNLLRDELYQYEDGINRTILNNITNATNFQLVQVRKYFEFHITNVTINTDTQINNFTMKLVEDIMSLHSFNSCAELGHLSLLFPSGIYRVRSYNCSFIHKYCSTNTAFSCSEVPGNWKRIAYLNTNENPDSCPDGTSNPPLCKRKDSHAGCSSVIYPSNGMLYSQVCGTVRVHPEGSPDAFLSDNTRIPRNGQSVNQNYVHGVSLTYGTSPNRNHIWTYTAAIKFGSDIDRCTTCDRDKPFYIGTNFTCTAEYCFAWPCDHTNAIWTDGLSCAGKETFYRQLSESTADNIEMRVCRDQDRSDEDILISFVEIFVL